MRHIEKLSAIINNAYNLHSEFDSLIDSLESFDVDLDDENETQNLNGVMYTVLNHVSELERKMSRVYNCFGDIVTDHDTEQEEPPPTLTDTFLTLLKSGFNDPNRGIF